MQNPSLHFSEQSNNVLKQILWKQLKNNFNKEKNWKMILKLEELLLMRFSHIVWNIIWALNMKMMINMEMKMRTLMKTMTWTRKQKKKRVKSQNKRKRMPLGQPQQLMERQKRNLNARISDLQLSSLYLLYLRKDKLHTTFQ